MFILFAGVKPEARLTRNQVSFDVSPVRRPPTAIWMALWVVTQKWRSQCSFKLELLTNGPPKQNDSSSLFSAAHRFRWCLLAPELIRSILNSSILKSISSNLGPLAVEVIFEFPTYFKRPISIPNSLKIKCIFKPLHGSALTSSTEPVRN